MLQKRLFGMPTLIVGVMLVFSLMGCDNGTTPGPQPPVPQSVTYVSKDSAGNLYTLEITEDTSGTTRYATKQGDFFKLTVELYNDGDYTVALSYEGRIGNTTAKSATEIEINLSVNNKPLTITISGTEMTLISGEIVDDNGETVVETPETLSPVADKTALGAALAAANAAKEGVVVSVNGADVLTTAYWVTQGQMDSFTSAIATAQSFYDEGDADQSMVNSARIALVAATTVFNGQKRLGTKTGGTQDENDVYVAGSYRVGGYGPGSVTVPCYWKNGTKYDLPNNTGDAEALDIAVFDGKVYVVGYYYINNSTWKACYWVDGVKIDFPDSPNPSGSMARAIAVFDGSIYVAGFVGNMNSNHHACYWKDGVLTVLPDSISSQATSIAVSGGSVYVGGYDIDYPYQTGCYWKDGVKTDLLPHVRDIAVDSGSVYVVAGGVDENAFYWKDGEKISLSLSGNPYPFSDALAIAISNGSVYVSGRLHDDSGSEKACYWKDGIRNDLPGGSHSSADAIAIYGDSIYVAGHWSNETTSKACYWKDGITVDLSENAMANGIFVVGEEVPPIFDNDIYVVGTVYTEESATATVWKNGQMTALPSTGYVWIQDVIVSGSDVFVLGNDCYWKNSVRVPLVPSSGNVSSARAMAISGSDVYVVGNTLNENDDWLACYWKNGNLTTLTTHRGSDATSIFIAGGDVYIAGYDEYGSFVDDYWSVSVQKACYWKNGNRILLTDGTSQAYADVITVSDGEIYILGSIGTWDSVAQKHTYVPCYWKGNTRIDLPVDSTYWISMDAMIVSNSNVYVLGREQQSDEGRHPAYWKNGVKVPLNGMDDYGDGTNHRTQMAVSGTDVYVAGDSMGVACYWKNGNKITLSAQESSASSIAVSGSDVYVAGRVSSAFTDSPSVACYWKNGTLVELSSNASARGIMVVAKN